MRINKNILPKDGVIVPVMVTILVVGATAVTLASRTFLTRKAAMKESEALSARKVAEGGIDELTNTLNSKYPSLYLENYIPANSVNGWETRAGKLSCGINLPNSATINGLTEGTINSDPNHYYKLESYEFTGNRYFGGIGTINMRGRLLMDGNLKDSDGNIEISNSNVKSSALVTQTVEINGKPCTDSDGGYGLKVDNSGKKPGDPNNPSWDISNLGNNNVLGGSLICVIDGSQQGCNDTDSMSSQINVSGDVTGGVYAEQEKDLKNFRPFVTLSEINPNNSLGFNLTQQNGLVVDGCHTASAISQPSIFNLVARLLDPAMPAWADHKPGHNPGGGGGGGGGSSDCGNLEIETRTHATRSSADNDEVDGYCQYIDIDHNGNGIIENVSGADKFESELICKFERLEFSAGNDLVIKTGSGVPVTIYLTGTCNGNCNNNKTLSFKGTSKIDHSGATVLNLYGNKSATKLQNANQMIEFKGNADANPATGQVNLRFPDGNVGIAGGGTNKCNKNNYKPLNCEPDIYGRVEALSWNGSNANDASIVVPENSNSNDPEVYAEGVKATGVTGWSSYTAN